MAKNPSTTTPATAVLSPAAMALIRAQDAGVIPRLVDVQDVAQATKVVDIALEANGWKREHPGVWTKDGRTMSVSWDGTLTVTVGRDQSARKVVSTTVARTAEDFLRSAGRATGGIHIGRDADLRALGAIEGSLWLERQLRDRSALSDPHGWFSNRAAWKILHDMGEAAQGLTVANLVPSAGVIKGESGRAYVLLPDGTVVLLGETASPSFRSAVQAIVQIL